MTHHNLFLVRVNLTVYVQFCSGSFCTGLVANGLICKRFLVLIQRITKSRDSPLPEPLSGFESTNSTNRTFRKSSKKHTESYWVILSLTESYLVLFDYSYGFSHSFKSRFRDFRLERIRLPVHSNPIIVPNVKIEHKIEHHALITWS